MPLKRQLCLTLLNFKYSESAWFYRLCVYLMFFVETSAEERSKV